MSLRSVRTRFTLWYTAVLSITLLFFSTGTYILVRASFLNHMDWELRHQTASLTRVLDHNPLKIMKIMEHEEGIFRVLDGENPFAATSSWSAAGLDKFSADGKFLSPRSWTAPNGRTYRLQSTITSSAGHGYRIAVAIDEQPTQQLLHLLAFIMLLSIPAAVVLAVAGGYLLAGRVLAPVSIMTAKAREITAERLSGRLPVEDTNDEFGQLATVFNQTFARLEDSFERMRRFTADASHELRTPLTAIRSVGEVGLQGNNDADVCRETIASMLEEADRLTKLVDALLTLSKADSNTIPLNRQPTDLNALVAEVIDCLQVLAEEKEQTLIQDDTEPVFAKVDYAILRQAVINLVDNAIKYTQPRGGIRVVVRPKAARDAVIEIIDNGPGIPQEHQARIFDRFYRIDRGRSRDMGGAGLGLAITRWAVETNGGQIEVESTEGGGSIFRIVLPAWIPPRWTVSRPTNRQASLR